MTAPETSRPRHLAAEKRILGVQAGGDGSTILRMARTVVISLFGAVGLLGLLIVALPLAGMQLVVLTSGSMSPGLPAGSLVVSRTVSASEVVVGDVVTVARPDGPPVTHRVVDAGGSSLSETRTLTLQGDANASPDPGTYRVDRVGVAIASVPWGGHVVLALRSPWVLGAMSVLIALLVLWSWWPREEREP